ncbi:DUF7535 family protein [Halalkalicoccus jeotgali]|uniref:Uncharacterized protein n=1 Tax=Halalkalicoccus jeotgali (strain DSM 18796 / CECT 7217 / JCM 14584 / KCTC 4019 / B3) TaxID=795797 RepID=D8J3U0_HALJB|nr:hypothetical protein [Halalkalicoccus jeotgali]ADJ13431.1 hypothetical protein HacjB3_00190 [Halalkalicoccus jeotgali B3]ELY32737.1 hypothetical protein C497_19149 [Halalkalicoccus jeotgali B3]
MSESEDSTTKKTLRTVTPYYRGRSDEEMNLIGIAYFLVLLVLLVPLLPFMIIVWVLNKVFGAIHQRAS